MNEKKLRIKQYEQAADDKVSLGGIKWERKWDVCVQCDSREEAERVRAALTAQPEQSPLDRMAENARELGLDYEPPMEDLRVQQSAWDNIPQEFNDWWNEDYDDSTNPFKLNSSAYWAWAGWQARRKKLAQPEQEPVAWVFTNQEGTEYCSERDSREGVWTPLYVSPNTIANSKAIPEQISGPEQEPPNLNCKSVQARLAAQWGYVKAEEEQKRPQNCGTSYCSCIECVMEPEQPEQKPTVPNNSQEWTGMDGATAYWLIQRHADGWPDISKMMGEWLAANTTPPRREWVGLTAEQISDLWDGHTVPVFGKTGINPIVFARAIEDKLREKNT